MNVNIFWVNALIVLNIKLFVKGAVWQLKALLYKYARMSVCVCYITQTCLVFQAAGAGSCIGQQPWSPPPSSVSVSADLIPSPGPLLGSRSAQMYIQQNTAGQDSNYKYVTSKQSHVHLRSGFRLKMNRASLLRFRRCNLVMKKLKRLTLYS